MIVPEGNRLRRYGPRRFGGVNGFGTILTAGTEAASSEAVYKAIAPDSTPVSSIAQLDAGRGNFIFRNGNGLNVGILGFVTKPSTASSPLATILFTYGEAAGTIGFIPVATLFAQGWRLAAKGRGADIYRAGGITKMPTAAEVSMDGLGAAIESILALIDEASALIGAKDYDSSISKITAAKALIADADSALKLMLDTGRVSRQTYVPMINILSALSTAANELQIESGERRGLIDDIVSKAAAAIGKAFDEAGYGAVQDVNFYVEQANGIIGLREKANRLRQMMEPYRNDPKILPLIKILELDDKVYEEAIQKVLAEEQRVAATDVPSLDGFGRLGAVPPVGVLAKLGGWLTNLWRGAKLTKKQARELLARGKLTPNQLEAVRMNIQPHKVTWLRSLAGFGKNGAVFFVTHLFPMWYFFSPYSWANKAADAERERRSYAYQVASRRFEELLLKGEKVEDAFALAEEYVKDLQKRINIPDIHVPDNLPGLSPAVKAAEAEMLAKLAQRAAQDKAKAAGDGKTSPLVWVLGGVAVAGILYLILSKKDTVEVPKPKLATRR